MDDKTVEKIVNLLVFFYEVIKVAIISCVPTRFRTKKSVRGEICLISGSGSGLGRLVALKLASLGCQMALVDIDVDGNRETSRMILERCKHAVVKTYVCDVSNSVAVRQLAKTVSEDMGDVSILINNAGIGAAGPILDVEDDSVSKTFAVNVMSHFYTVKAFLPAMIKSNHGHLVHLCSSAGLMGVPKMSSYSASKFAVFGLAESLQLELLAAGHDGVKSTTVCLAPVNTGFLRYDDNGLVPMLDPEYVARQIVEGILLDREIVYVPRLLTYPMLFLRPLVTRRAILAAFKIVVGDGVLKDVAFRNFGK